tara:strand:- start:645 stop:821 length:177 start_codon:yes stop_codon:yes gene_type:complete
VRTAKELDGFKDQDLQAEYEKLITFDSLTVLQYIQTSVEILMSMKKDDVPAEKTDIHK